MSKKMKLSPAIACVFYVLTILGFFYLDLKLIIVLFLLFTLSITYFAYQGYRSHNDYTGAEHLQQEIGILKAEKEQMAGDYEALEKKKDKEIKDLRQYGETLNASLSNTEKERNELKKELEKAVLDADKNKLSEAESILPPESDEDDNAQTDIVEVTHGAVDELDAAAKKAGIRINITSQAEKLILKCSANRLRIMFRNIIDNSIKYMQNGGSLVITISVIDDDAFIVLKDTGEGIPEDELKHIFELNYQGSNMISGTGLGLTQAKAIVEHYGGTIYARSPQGNGMGIYIQLPLSATM
ncbi:MAG: HAMP domain-containing histidine kinase [Butyrivibrio sp.]|nr:HAMP domain-containing histidine kinase [Butyrivibrio sp.]